MFPTILYILTIWFSLGISLLLVYRFYTWRLTFIRPRWQSYFRVNSFIRHILFHLKGDMSEALRSTFWVLSFWLVLPIKWLLERPQRQVASEKSVRSDKLAQIWYRETGQLWFHYGALIESIDAIVMGRSGCVRISYDELLSLRLVSSERPTEVILAAATKESDEYALLAPGWKSTFEDSGIRYDWNSVEMRDAASGKALHVTLLPDSGDPMDYFTTVLEIAKCRGIFEYMLRHERQVVTEILSKPAQKARLTALRQFIEAGDEKFRYQFDPQITMPEVTTEIVLATS